MRMYQKEQMKDSRIFFDKRPPAFGNIFLVFTICVLIGAFLVSSSVAKPYIVNAQGVVNTTDHKYVSTEVPGTVVEILVEEGETVESGQILLRISSGEEELRVKALLGQTEQIQLKIDAMDRYQKSLLEKKNLMRNEGIEQEYYGYVEYYLAQYSNENYSSHIQEDSLDKNIEKQTRLTNEISKIQSEIDLIKIPDVSSEDVQKIQNQITNKSNEINQLVNELEKTTNTLESSVIQDKITSKEIELQKLETNLNNLQRDLTTSENLQMKVQDKQSTLASKQSELSSIESEIKLAQEQNGTPATQSDQMLAQLTAELGKNRTAAMTQLEEMEANKSIYLGQIDTHLVTAGNNGVVHFVIPLKEGVTLQQNQTIAEVSTQESSKFLIEAYINASDISKVSIGNKVNVSILGSNTVKYGSIVGNLESIDSGTITQESNSGNMLFYRALVSINGAELNSKHDSIRLLKAMPVEAKIIYEEETYLEWVLNMLNFKD